MPTGGGAASGLAGAAAGRIPRSGTRSPIFSMFPVPQMGEQLPNVVQFFSAQLPVVAEPVIEVPKILPHDVPLRRLCRETQLAEQLV